MNGRLDTQLSSPRRKKRLVLGRLLATPLMCPAGRAMLTKLSTVSCRSKGQASFYFGLVLLLADSVTPIEAS